LTTSAMRQRALANQRALAKIQVLHSQASRLAAVGKYSAAATVFRKALRLTDKRRDLSPIPLAALLNDYGVVCKYVGQFGEASRNYRRALKLIDGAGGVRNHGDFAATLYHNLGGVEHARRRFRQGLRYARRGIRLRKKVRPRDALALAADEAALAAILAELGRNSEAVEISLRVLARFQRDLGPKHAEVGAVSANLGPMLWKLGKAREAERRLRLAVSILDKALGRNHPRSASALNNLGYVCARNGKVREARALYRRARHPTKTKK
jgi:tetratricopeptide (TPR) repeat protein